MGAVNRRIVALAIFTIGSLEACDAVCGEGFIGTLRCNTDQECLERAASADASSGKRLFCNMDGGWVNSPGRLGRGVCFFDRLDAGSVDSGSDASVDSGIDAGPPAPGSLDQTF